MANVNITIKRNNSGTYDNLYPKTTPEQVEGLLSGGKIAYTYLPSYVVGGMRFYNTADVSGGSSTLGTLFSGLVAYGTSADAAAQAVGSYIIVTAGGSVADVAYVTSTSAGYVFNVPGDEGDSTTPVVLEAGDWIVLKSRTTPSAGVVIYTFDIINNTYQDAGTAAKGIVTLSSQTVYANLTGDKVVTDGVLKTVIDNANFALAGHNHNGTYQPVDGDLTAIAALAGTSGFLKKTAADTWTLDTNSYSLSNHVHGNITNDGKIGSTSDLVVVTGSAGVLTTQSRSGIDSRATFPVAVATTSTLGGITINYTSTETNRAVLLSGNDAYVSLPRQIPAVTLNGSSSTSPSFYAPTGAGTSGQLLQSSGSGAPVWATINKFLYDTTTGAATGDIIFDNDATA